MESSFTRKPLILVLPMLAAITALADSSGTAVLQLQKAPAITGPWLALPASVAALTPEGGVADTLTNASFYRLKITTTNAGGGLLTVPLASAPTQAVQEAQAMLNSNPGGALSNRGAALTNAATVA